MLNRQRTGKKDFLIKNIFLHLPLIKILFTEFKRKRLRLDWRWLRRHVLLNRQKGKKEFF